MNIYNNQKFKVGDVVKSRFHNSIGIIVYDPNIECLYVQVTKSLGKAITDEWELHNVSK